MTIAHAIDLVSGEFWGRNPHEELAWLRANDPVFFDTHSGLWALTKYDHVREAETTPVVFSNAQGSRPGTGPMPMLIDTDDPIHARRRGLVTSGFTPKHVRALREPIRKIVDDLIDAVEDRESFDLVTDVAAWLPLKVIGDAMGMDPKDHPTLLEWSDDLMRGQGTSDPALIEKMTAAFAGWRTFITEVIADRRNDPGDDVIGALVAADIDGQSLTEDELIFDTLLILIGGDETTRHVITGGAYQLLSDRTRWEKLRDTRGLLNSAVEEMLRWVSPIKSMHRVLTRDIDFHGKRMSAGDGVLLLYPSANRDADHFTDPFTFDIERSPNDHIAFGAGPHFCLGASLARLELRVIFDRLLDRMPDLALATPDEPHHRPASFISGYESLPVVRSP